jgi:chromosome segregation ATPase
MHSWVYWRSIFTLLCYTTTTTTTTVPSSVTGAEEKLVHEALDTIVTRLHQDILAAQKKHDDAVAEYQKQAGEAEQAKGEWTAADSRLAAVKPGYQLAVEAEDKAEKKYLKEEAEVAPAKAAADDTTWQEETKKLKAAEAAIALLRVQVEKLNAEYTHPSK